MLDFLSGQGPIIGTRPITASHKQEAVHGHMADDAIKRTSPAHEHSAMKGQTFLFPIP
jgi:hypothetical protein